METWIKKTLDHINPILRMYGEASRVCFNIQANTLESLIDESQVIWIVGIAGSGKNWLAGNLHYVYKSVDAISAKASDDWICDVSLINQTDKVLVGSADNSNEIYDRLCALFGIANVNIVFVWPEPDLYREINQYRSQDARYAIRPDKVKKYVARAALSDEEVCDCCLHAMWSYLDKLPLFKTIDIVFNSKESAVFKANDEY